MILKTRSNFSPRAAPLLLPAALLCAALLGSGCGTRNPDKRLASEMEDVLFGTLLDPWYPRCVDADSGGFLPAFDADWKPDSAQPKAVVNQARHTWTTAQTARFFPEREGYAAYAEHGFRFLRDRQWDGEYGGFFQTLGRGGGMAAASGEKDEKRAYGNAFGIFACAACFSLTGDSTALRLGRDAFLWLETHAHDPVHGGYFQNLKRNGTPIRAGDPSAAGFDRATAGLKDQNSSIHLLEAFTALYRVWPDPLLRVRVEEMQGLIRDRMVGPEGSLRLFFRPDWTPVSFRDSSEAVREANRVLDHVSFGHDMETAYLLLEASEALGMAGDSVTLARAQYMVDRALAFGWDGRNGGVYYMGVRDRNGDSVRIVNDSKEWWVQAEALHSLLMMSRLFPEKTLYAERFEEEWAYMKAYLFDRERGGWYAAGLDNRPEARNSHKGHAWKAAYHETRSLIHCLKILDPERYKPVL